MLVADVEGSPFICSITWTVAVNIMDSIFARNTSTGVPKKFLSQTPNFYFTHVDVRKKLYNSDGKFSLKETLLPYPERMFDVIWAHSLFTHMIFDEMEHYIAEFSRIMKGNGTLYASYYLMNDVTAEGISKRTAGFDFTNRVGECFTFDTENPEEGVAQSESFVKRIYQKYGFSIIEPIHYSDWDKHTKPDQDFIIADLIE
ncbi:MAG TPA: methyltransferase domain-containing protein [Thermodesulfovibrionales bacterium]|nr:methyltransferase domain-containing protein [Thermodesulfovibrionales bacterium]